MPAGKLDDPSKFEATIKFFRNISFGYSQLDFEGVDQILTDYLHHRMKTCSQAADVLESEYTDIVDVIKSREGDIALSRQVGRVLAGDEDRQRGRDLGEWLYRLTNDDDFQNELGQIRERHQNEFDEMSQELSQMEEEEQAIAKALTQKYGVEFISSQ